jgi:hypothetical protein
MVVEVNMNSTKRKEARQAEKERSFVRFQLKLSKDSLEDATRRGMNTQELLYTYVEETAEVIEATRRMKGIDEEILRMPIEQQLRREKLLRNQRKVLTQEDLALLGDTLI